MCNTFMQLFTSLEISFHFTFLQHGLTFNIATYLTDFVHWYLHQFDYNDEVEH